MSRRRPNSVFSVELAGGGRVIVVARHPKGARGVAVARGLEVGRDLDRAVTRVDASLAGRAINVPVVDNKLDGGERHA